MKKNILGKKEKFAIILLTALMNVQTASADKIYCPKKIEVGNHNHGLVVWGKTTSDESKGHILLYGILHSASLPSHTFVEARLEKSTQIICEYKFGERSVLLRGNSEYSKCKVIGGDGEKNIENNYFECEG